MGSQGGIHEVSLEPLPDLGILYLTKLQRDTTESKFYARDEEATRRDYVVSTMALLSGLKWEKA